MNKSKSIQESLTKKRQQMECGKSKLVLAGREKKGRKSERHHWTGTKDEKFWKVGREQARVDSGEGQRFWNQNILTRLAAV